MAQRARPAAAPPGVAGRAPPRRAAAGRLPHRTSTAPGIDFADLRTYTPEDDVRHIDWNVTARLDEPYVRQYTEDRELTAWLLLDRSRVDGGSAPPERGKDVVLTELAVTPGPAARPAAATGSARCCSTSGVERVIAAAHRPHPRAAPGPRAGQAGRPRRPRRARPPTSPRCCTLRRGHDPPALAWCSSSPTSSPATAGSGRWPAWPSATRWSPCAWSTRSSASCPTSALIVVEDAETGEQVLVDTSDPCSGAASTPRSTRARTRSQRVDAPGRRAAARRLHRRRPRRRAGRDGPPVEAEGIRGPERSGGALMRRRFKGGMR